MKRDDKPARKTKTTSVKKDIRSLIERGVAFSKADRAERGNWNAIALLAGDPARDLVHEGKLNCQKLVEKRWRRGLIHARNVTSILIQRELLDSDGESLRGGWALTPLGGGSRGTGGSRGA